MTWAQVWASENQHSQFFPADLSAAELIANHAKEDDSKWRDRWKWAMACMAAWKNIKRRGAT
jgi:hypothetical protein